MASACFALLIGACGGDGPGTGPGTPPAPRARLAISIAGGPLAVSDPALRAAGFGVRVQGPASFDTLLTRSGTLSALEPGSYQILSPRITYDSVRYAAEFDAQTVLLLSNTPRDLLVRYEVVSGALRLTASGVAGDSTTVRATVRYPDARVDTVALPTSLLLLAPGTYFVAGIPREVNGLLATPIRAVDTVLVAAAATPTTLNVPFTESRASLRLLLTGIATGDLPGSVSLTLPSGAMLTVQPTSDTVRFPQLLAGRYIIRASAFSAARARYTPLRSADTVNISAGATVDRALAYQRDVASLALLLQGVPAGSGARVTITGPGAFSGVFERDTVLRELMPGNYTLSADSIAVAGHRWSADSSSRIVPVTFGAQSNAVVAFSLRTGALSVQILGLPDSLDADVRVTRTTGAQGNDFPWVLPRSSTRVGLPPGSYTIAAASHLIGARLFRPALSTQTVAIGASLTPVVRTVSYTESVGPTLDFMFEGAYITQAVQRFDGTVPLVAGREALLRVFARANEGNAEIVSVRVRLYEDTVLYRTFTIPSPSTSVPQARREGDLATTWNVNLSASEVRPGMSFVADFGPPPGLSDASPGNNRFPLVGQQPVSVRRVPPFSIRLIPIQHPLDSLTGNVSGGNADNLVSVARALLPFVDTQLSVRVPFQSSAGKLLANDANGAWATVLNEMNALRTLDGAGNEYYMAIVGTSYSSGIAGLAALGARYAVSWDKPLTGPRVLAHELGHNFGRYHSPGCGASFIDVNYPHIGGSIGAWGWNGTNLVDPTLNDIMGYCNAQWISDYTWTGILNYREQSGARGDDRDAAAVRGSVGGIQDSMLMLWGRVTSDGAILEPMLRVRTQAALPPVGLGRYTLQLRGEDGIVLQTLRFDGDAIDHKPDAMTFSAAVPLTGIGSQPYSLELRRGTQLLATRRMSTARGALPVASRAATDARSLPPAPRVSRRSARSASLEWNDSVWPLALVRDAASGTVLGFLRRSGDQLTVTSATSLEITFSDGVASRTVMLPTR